LRSTLTTKGQVTIPVEIRRAAGLETGAQIEFIVNTRNRIELIPRQGDIRSLRGIVPSPPRSVSLREMHDALATGRTPRHTPDDACAEPAGPDAPPRVP
jgi:antitoxin PrlF